jgi:hemolysin III
MADISAQVTRKSLKAKKKAAIKNIKAQAKEKIREIKIEYDENPARKLSRQNEKAQRKAYRMQRRNAHIAYNARQPRLYTIGEELFNSISHGIGAGLSVAALVILIVASCSRAPATLLPIYIVAVSLFGSALFLMYMVSTLYHALTPYGARKVFSIFNHISIYLLIAASYTPFALIKVGGVAGWWIFGIAWGLALVCSILYSVFGARMRMQSVLTYVVFGWLFVAVLTLLKDNPLSSTCLAFVFSGGTAYTVGCLFYLMRKYKWTHSIFHLFVLAGSVLHFFAVLSII